MCGACTQQHLVPCRAAAIHGAMDQHTRMQVLSDYKSGKHHVLVATDVAARGLDIKSIKTVVNVDAARDIDTHVHRVGRTGRAGDKDGVAYTLVTSQEARFAGNLPLRSLFNLQDRRRQALQIMFCATFAIRVPITCSMR